MAGLMERILNSFGYFKGGGKQEALEGTLKLIDEGISIKEPSFKRPKRDKTVKKEIYEFLMEKGRRCKNPEIYEAIAARTNPPATIHNINFCLRRLCQEGKISHPKKGEWRIKNK